MYTLIKRTQNLCYFWFLFRLQLLFVSFMVNIHSFVAKAAKKGTRKIENNVLYIDFI